MTERDSRLGILFIVLAALLWGTLGIVFRVLQSDYGSGPLAIGFWRALIAALTIGVLLGTRRPALLKISARDLPVLLGYGLVSVAIFFVIYPAAVTYSSVAVAAVLLYTAPAWVILLAALFFREQITPRKAVALLLTFVGVALIAGVTGGDLSVSAAGLFTGLGAGFTYATFSIFGKAALKDKAPVTTVFYGLLFGALFLLPFVLGPERDAFLAPLAAPNGWALLLYMGVLPTAGSFWLYLTGLGYLNDAGRASVLATLEPVIAAALGYLVLGESLTPIQLAGGALVVIGILLTILRRPRPKAKAGQG